MAFAELQITSNFGFLRGASHPEELVVQAQALGLAGLALTDRNSLAGIVRAHQQAEASGLRFLVGCRLDLVDGTSLLCWPTGKPAYARLSSLLTLEDVLAHDAGQVFALLPPETPDAAFAELAARLHRRWQRNLYLALSHRYAGDDAPRLAELGRLARGIGIKPLATNDVHYHHPDRRPLQDVLTCIREHTKIQAAAPLLFANAERHLKSPGEMARLFRDHPDAIESTLEIVERCRFSLGELAYDYPTRDSYDDRTPDQELARRTWAGARERYPDRVPEKVERLIRRELELIRELRYAPYFLTVHDIVLYARSRDILCQGRGSAANSAVCYALHITAVDPARLDLLFERFISTERREPPDIDVDFEHERREEVIQWVYATYGRDHAALAATVIRYRAKSAMREVAKVMGLSADVQEALTRTVWGYGRDGLLESPIREAGLDPDEPTLRRTLGLAQELIGFPRHLSQHVGGFVIARSPLRELVPIENAAMPERTVVEWDKDDLDALRMLKIDLLALGMLSCIRRAFELLRAHHGVALGDIASIPAEDPAVYAMLGNADTIGVFQVESRAQMSMLPRLKPKEFYDLVIEVAIVRPGPIQGDMVHPYLRRREGSEPVIFASPAPEHGPPDELERVLGRTKGVPLFQEQAMRIAIEAAKFTAEEANALRRAMATFRHVGTIHTFERKMVERMVERGYDRGFAERCFQQIKGFGEYGFPESHAASFALLVYVSAWLKCHYPDVFCAAILNAQPIGFYAPAQLVRDAVDHGVEVRAVDVNHSHWDSTLEPRQRRGPLMTAVRLGFRQVKGLPDQEANRIVTARLKPYRTLEELKRRTGLRRATLVRLAEADAFRSLGLDRRQALWAVQAQKDPPLPLFEHAMASAPAGSNLPALEGSDEPWLELPEMGLGEQVIEDYATLRLSLKAHPLALLRGWLTRKRAITARQLWHTDPGRRVTVCGLVLVRQRPGSAKGVIFSTLEDETGFANLIIWPKVFERHRATVMTARLLAATGTLQREGRVIHVVAERLTDASKALRRLRDHTLDPRALDGAMSPADEAKRGTRDVRDAMPEGRNFR
jgi:error-prone DNA polymerase